MQPQSICRSYGGRCVSQCSRCLDSCWIMVHASAYKRFGVAILFYRLAVWWCSRWILYLSQISIGKCNRKAIQCHISRSALVAWERKREKKKGREGERKDTDWVTAAHITWKFVFANNFLIPWLRRCGVAIDEPAGFTVVATFNEHWLCDGVKINDKIFCKIIRIGFPWQSKTSFY